MTFRGSLTEKIFHFCLGALGGIVPFGEAVTHLLITIPQDFPYYGGDFDMSLCDGLGQPVPEVGIVMVRDHMAEGTGEAYSSICRIEDPLDPTVLLQVGQRVVYLLAGVFISQGRDLFSLIFLRRSLRSSEDSMSGILEVTRSGCLARP